MFRLFKKRSFNLLCVLDLVPERSSILLKSVLLISCVFWILFQKGVLLRSKGDKTATCPGRLVGCTANTDRYKSLSNCHLSECQSRQDICNSITEADITVEHCRTEGDSNLHKDVTESMQDVDPSHQVNCLADLVHLSQTQFRSAKRKTFSDS